MKHNNKQRDPLAYKLHEAAQDSSLIEPVAGILAGAAHVINQKLATLMLSYDEMDLYLDDAPTNNAAIQQALQDGRAALKSLADYTALLSNLGALVREPKPENGVDMPVVIDTVLSAVAGWAALINAQISYDRTPVSRAFGDRDVYITLSLMMTVELLTIGGQTGLPDGPIVRVGCREDDKHIIIEASWLNIPNVNLAASKNWHFAMQFAERMLGHMSAQIRYTDHGLLVNLPKMENASLQGETG